jgi:hypothetical protein
MYTGVIRLFSESGVVESAFDTASTLDVSFEDSSCVFGDCSLLGGLVEYAELVGGVVCFGRRLRSGSRDGLSLVMNHRVHGRGSRKDHLAAGSMLDVIFAVSRAVVVLKVSL